MSLLLQMFSESEEADSPDPKSDAGVLSTMSCVAGTGEEPRKAASQYCDLSGQIQIHAVTKDVRYFNIDFLKRIKQLLMFLSF